MKQEMKEIEINILAEKIKYIEENLSRAINIQNILRTEGNEISSVKVRNLYIDRNEYISNILRELDSLGYEVTYLRPWQKDVSKQMSVLIHFFEDVKEVKQQKMA